MMDISNRVLDEQVEPKLNNGKHMLLCSVKRLYISKRWLQRIDCELNFWKVQCLFICKDQELQAKLAGWQNYCTPSRFVVWNQQ